MNTWRFRLVLAVMAAMLGAAGAARAGDEAVVLLVPARVTVVQYAFDIARLRPAYLISYDAGSADEPPWLHVWDTGARTWRRIEPGAFADGAFFATPPARVFWVVEPEMPGFLERRTGWMRRVTRIESLRVVDLVNAMAEPLELAPREWTWLARRHDLDLKDINAAQRRYGRYGPPGATPRGGRVFGDAGNPRSGVQTPEAPAVAPAPEAPARIAPPPRAGWVQPLQPAPAVPSEPDAAAVADEVEPRGDVDAMPPERIPEAQPLRAELVDRMPAMDK